ncbi:hypothetical protein EST38_g5603 [Candolleomyces aberdarensis]|uniref:Cytochrome P450 n=1 Tax=Candolleomyces aberdarensis TaxID=2316362 RepID=A0A4Q2DLS1_9AGAR|nr:hypothetical protein EST38_g5603 [Candolleomyces aberdarensis]
MNVAVAAQLIASLAATLGAYGLYKALKFIYVNRTSPLRHLPGPPNKGFIWGNLKEIMDSENSELHEKWIEEYGRTISYRGLFGMNRLYTTDLKAINHVLMNSYIYQKPAPARYQLGQILGEGVLVVEGDEHKKQRRVMNPAFGAAQIRELTDIFVEKSIELRNAWESEVRKQGEDSEPPTVDVLSWLSRMTLDVIGLAGFNYKFNALSEGKEKNELNKAFSKIFETNASVSIIPLLRGFFPALRWLPADRDAETKQARRTMDRIGRELLDNSKEALRKGGLKVDKESLKSKDLLTLLLRANMATDIPEHQRMSEDDVLAQVPTFLAAGHETTSTSTTWALFAIAKAPEVQAKLRDELLTVSSDNVSMDELNALPYLDAVVRETLRIHAPVPSTLRVAVEDDVLPLTTPVTDRNGKVYESIPIQKGQTLFIPVIPINRDKKIWGEDGHEFNPERWLSPLEAASSIPGVWGNMLTFLGGPRACIGYRFSLVEMKALLFTLVRAFEFELGVPAEDIGKKSSVVQRPFLRSNPEAGNQMPLKIKLYQRA